jgi:ubiquinone/menaquinone biosynthesis C-methylase UbiE
VSVREQRATSFGSVAESYDKVRPGPAPAAVDWLLPRECSIAVDLAAGTGLFTRALRGRVPQVVAVEPDERMREVLAAHSAGTTVLAGRAEAIPLPDGYADAVFVSTAWHWFDPGLAAREIARVLKDGGRLGIVWTSRDREDDWVAGLDVLRTAGEPRTVQEVRAKLARHHTVTLPADAGFGPARTASFGFTRTQTINDTLDWLATSSGIITAEPGEREAGMARSRAALTSRSADGTLVEMPLRSWCWQADRLPR